MTPSELKQRTKRFALDVIKLYRLLPYDPIATILGKQLVRCATSVGANYRAACLAKSNPDMVNKLKMVEEEADEAAFWLELLEEGQVVQIAEIGRLCEEATEIRKIVSASIKTLRNRQS